jgi:hypothetical protein
MKQSHIDAIAKANKVEARQSAHLSHMNSIGAITSSKRLERKEAVESHIKSCREAVIRDIY